MAVQEQIPLRLVGKRFKRADAPERLTGSVRYTGDLVLPGLLYGRLVRSPHASARILSVDKQEALATPGVVAVLTAQDLTGTQSPRGGGEPQHHAGVRTRHVCRPAGGSRSGRERSRGGRRRTGGAGRLRSPEASHRAAGSDARRRLGRTHARQRQRRRAGHARRGRRRQREGAVAGAERRQPSEIPPRRRRASVP